MDNKYNITADSIVNKSIERLATRSEVGVRKYNTTLEDSHQTFPEFINHFIEEMADGLNYGEKMLDMFELQENKIKKDLIEELYTNNHISTLTYNKYNK